MFLQLKKKFKKNDGLTGDQEKTSWMYTAAIEMVVSLYTHAQVHY